MACFLLQVEASGPATLFRTPLTFCSCCMTVNAGPGCSCSLMSLRYDSQESRKTHRCTGMCGPHIATCWTAVTLTESVRAELQDASRTQNCDGAAQKVQLSEAETPPPVSQVTLTSTGEDSIGSFRTRQHVSMNANALAASCSQCCCARV